VQNEATVDEISHRKGQRYLTVVVDHHTGRLVWAAPGRDRRMVLAFFDALGEERCKQIELVSADMAAWISGPIAERAPQAKRCVDPFHVVMVRHEALLIRAGCKTPLRGCRGSPVKLRTV